MKSADEWFEAGMEAVDRSRGADHCSEYTSDMEEAAAAFQRALELAPYHAAAARELGFALALLDRHEPAAAALAQAARLAPGDVDTLRAWGQSLALFGLHSDALAAYDATLRLAPHDKGALFGRAQELTQLARHADALEAWEAFLAQPDDATLQQRGDDRGRLSPDWRRPRARVERAQALACLRRSDVATEAFRQIIAMDAPALLTPLTLSGFAAAIAEHEEARLAYREHLQVHRVDPVAWRLAAQLYASAKRADDAAAACAELLALAPSDEENWLVAGDVLAVVGRRDEAVKAYGEALRLRPDYLGPAGRLRGLGIEPPAAPQPPTPELGRRLRVPADIAFSFEGQVLRGQTANDGGLALLRKSETLTRALASALGETALDVERQETVETRREEAGPFSFPVTKTSVTLICGNASFVVQLERMRNSHLGCNEDDFSFSLTAGTKRVTGRCYLYATDELTLADEGLSDVEQRAVEAVLVGGLGLQLQ